MSAAPARTSTMATRGEDVPRAISSRPSPGDRIFRGVLRGGGIVVLVITGSILLFLLLRSTAAFGAEGLKFFTTSATQPPNDFGIAALLPDTVAIALIALAVGFPAGLAAAIYISEYAPSALRRPLIAVIDLLAAIPSIVFALWGLLFLMPKILGSSAWLSQHLRFIPIFHVPLPNTPASYVGSLFIAGIVVGMLVTPIITSLCRQVFSQAPQGEREAAYALGATRWGMVRTVVLPFGRAGIIGTAMLGLGRALGETIVVTFILLSPSTLGFTDHILQSGGSTITSEIGDEIKVTTGQGVAIYKVAAFGDSHHLVIDLAPSRLILLTAGSPYVPTYYSYVDADLVSAIQPQPGGLPPVFPDETPLAGDPSALVLALLWAMTLAGVAAIATVGATRWAPWPTYLAAAPVVIVVVWNLYHSLAALLPNVY